AWVEAQNAVTFAYLNALPERDALRTRLEELYDSERYGMPWKEAGRYFYSYNSGLQDQSVIYVTDDPGRRGKVLLDPNTLSEDGTVALSALAVSPDGRHLGYGLAVAGSDWQELHVRDIETGEDLGDRIEWVKFSGMSWTEDAEGFFYSRYPEPRREGDRLLEENRNQMLYYHRVRTPQSEDRLILEFPDHPDWFVSADVTEDGRYAILSVGKSTDPENRLFVLDLEDPQDPALDAEPMAVVDNFDASYNVIGNDGSVLYAVTNRDAPNRRIIAIDLEDPAPESWREVVPESEHVLQYALAAGDRLVAVYLEDAKTAVRFFEKDGTPAGELDPPGIGSISVRGDAGDPELYYSFTSFTYPSTIYRYDLRTGESEVFREPDLTFDPSEYETQQVFYTSKDGTRVPMFITHRKGLEPDGDAPTLLYGYGGFNVSLTPSFSSSRVAFLERGGIYAQANLRGGGEYGKPWHEAGTKERKQNVFDDFIAAAEYLIDEGYTRPERLAISGGSNGGLLVGAVLNQRPDLYGAAIPAVGVMDMLRFHQFTIGWAWTGDYGSSETREGFEYLYAYSPLHNIRTNVCYPATLVTTADHDDRVVPGHSFKYAATLQEAQGCDRPTIIRIETRAGHGAGKPTSKIIEEQADRWAFVLYNLGVTGHPAPTSTSPAARPRGQAGR
ncbi:MAG: prolyl oligopeptidase family serine peptidase, partial [Longimicrobiales bacterium]|nr:prolyl oligopeptidase family serine peptidase [Longimicrobiales bacterium]